MDATIYSEVLEQQVSLVRDMMTRGGYWLAGVDREKVTSCELVTREPAIWPGTSRRILPVPRRSSGRHPSGTIRRACQF